jgi:hypothetical protein
LVRFQETTPGFSHRFQSYPASHAIKSGGGGKRVGVINWPVSAISYPG